MQLERLSQFTFGDICLEYHQDHDLGTVQMRMYPSELTDLVVPSREVLPSDRPECGVGWPAYTLEPLVHLSLAELPIARGRISCKSLGNSTAVTDLQFVSQEVLESTADKEVVTTLEHPTQGYRVRHYLTYRAGQAAVSVRTCFINCSERTLTLQQLASFSLGGVTPFDSEEAVGRMAMHRFRSWWSAEGRHEVRSYEAMHFERSWGASGYPIEKFGQVGSVPVTEFFPFVGIEDSGAGVFWGAQLQVAASWQIEVARRDDHTSISGGLADRMLGHWQKAVKPGEYFESPSAWLTTCHGQLSDLTQRLTSMQQPDVTERSPREACLPVIFNEWCSNWGNTSHDKVMALAERIQELGVDYFVIDDGWAKRPPEATMQSNGDWIVETDKFPDMSQTTAALKAMGYVPGVWFEFEVCNTGSLAFELTEHHLHRDGAVLQVGSRRFWDFRDPWVIDHLSEKVIGFLNQYGFRYIKVDYNETLGLGVDSADGLGEGLRQHIEGVQAFFRKIRAEVPDVVIENCASGGHRLEPTMMALADMASFSDAHKNASIPIIARNVQHLILPSQSQIWAVLMAKDSDRRLIYSLAGCYYGRMCLSGEVHALSDAQLAIVKRAVEFYKAAAPIIRDGRSDFYEAMHSSYRDPVGWLGVVRAGRGAASDQLLVSAHCFAEAPQAAVELPLPAGEWQVESIFAESETSVSVVDGQCRLQFAGDFSGCGILLRRVEASHSNDF